MLYVGQSFKSEVNASCDIFYSTADCAENILKYEVTIINFMRSFSNIHKIYRNNLSYHLSRSKIMLSAW